MAWVCNNAAVLMQASDSGGNPTGLARLAVRAYEQLEENGAGEAEGRLIALNTLACTLLFGASADPSEALNTSAAAVELAERRARELRTVHGAADLAMCLDTHAQALVGAGNFDAAMSAISFALQLRLDAVLAAGGRLLSGLVHGARSFAAIAGSVGRDDEIAAMWASLDHELPEPLCTQFAQLRETPEADGRSYSV